LSGTRCRLAYGPADANATLASVKSRLVLPFWYWLTWVVLEKGLLNVCVCVAAFDAVDWVIEGTFGHVEKLLHLFSDDLI